MQPDLLAQLPLFPAFLPQALTELPKATVHVVQRDIARSMTSEPF